ncbi:polyprenyl synthetase family protein [Pseudochelatococcus contaminans]|uniref:Probable farnesyl diphosphate synthase n=1 Tax=Pseudochelatococcus contaminans TaxID=1538103 RepID=A0A7W6EIC3_9HYPH|nr:farnesyl diphosphate synthase [Pseudochelatococcus contaminans]MBB3811009.1 farnesyl diphosphate synthase [Pseudochelatococcus contaminans]
MEVQATHITGTDLDPEAAFQRRLTAVASAVEERIAALLDDAPRRGETARPARLIAAMRHAMLGGGKRLRPFLVIETAALFDVPFAHALNAACALELVHGYSLVHDDLPSMDDDDLRRGRPTVHREFDEATAILAGDALLTLAFDVAADETSHADPAVRVALVQGLARAAGVGGMVGGQIIDLAAEGRYGDVLLDEARVRRLQAMKTGALFAYAIDAGATIGRASLTERQALGTYGRALGAAFQIADDLLDLESSTEALGKRAAKDSEKGKATLVAVLGPDRARRERDTLVETAIGALSSFGAKADTLRAAARFTALRKF